MPCPPGSGALATWNSWSSGSRWRGCWASAGRRRSRSRRAAGSFSSLLLATETIRAVPNPWAGLYARLPKQNVLYVLASLRLAQSCLAIRAVPRRSSCLLPEPRWRFVRPLRRPQATNSGPHARRTAGFVHRIMTYEKWGIFFHCLLVLVIASFSVVGALAMIADVETRRRSPRSAPN